MYCDKPDRDSPKMKCGYPLPCPFHTVIIDATKEPPTVTTPVTAQLTPRARRRVIDVARVFGDISPAHRKHQRNQGKR
jgi:hypothetical protein